MLKLGIDERWVWLAMETACRNSYSMLINGKSRGHITPSQGIRQGDLLSLYLFLLGAEDLSSLIRNAIISQSLHGILSCTNEVCISHLLFVDDCFIFYQATVEECQHLLHLLRRYEEASNQTINR